MIGVLLISHGKMADGIKDCAELIMGQSEALGTASLIAGQDFDEFKGDVYSKIKALDSGEGVLVFVDLFGASPYNAAMFSIEGLKNDGVNVRIITGMNLPMVMECLSSREGISLIELAALALSSGKDGITDPVADILENSKDQEDEGDY